MSTTRVQIQVAGTDPGPKGEVKNDQADEIDASRPVLFQFHTVLRTSSPADLRSTCSPQ